MRILKPLILFVALVWNQGGAGGELSPFDGVNATRPLTLPDLKGTPHRLENYRGSVVLLNFWASWCAPCLIEMPGMQRLLDSLQDRPFAILAANVGESRETAWRFTNMLNLNFPVLLDEGGNAAQQWDVQVYPTSYLIDPDGKIRYTAYGSIDWGADNTRQLIEQLMPDSDIAPQTQSARVSE